MRRGRTSPSKEVVAAVVEVVEAVEAVEAVWWWRCPFEALQAASHGDGWSNIETRQTK